MNVPLHDHQYQFTHRLPASCVCQHTLALRICVCISVRKVCFCHRLSACDFVCICTSMCMFLVWVCVCDDSMSSQVIMHLLRKCYQIMLTPQPGAPHGKRRWVGGNGMRVCIMHMIHFPTFQQLRTPKVKTLGDAADAYVSELIFIMCAIEKSKLLFTLDPFALRWLTYQSRGDDMEECSPTGADWTGPDWTGGIIACMWLHSTG